MPTVPKATPNTPNDVTGLKPAVLPRIEYRWVWKRRNWKIDWRMLGANNEIMCSSNQGFETMSHARASIVSVMRACGNTDFTFAVNMYFREKLPGKKPDPKNPPKEDYVWSDDAGLE